MRGPPQSFGAFDADEHALLAAGRHEELATRLRAAGRHALAGWVYEQVWAFESAMEAYRADERWLDALRSALDAASGPGVDGLLTELQDLPEADFASAVALLRKRGRDMDVARLLAGREGDPEEQAAALLRAGNNLGAAQTLADAGLPRDALEALDLTSYDPGHDPGPEAQALAARLAWALGDAEGAARHAQRALRRGASSVELAALLARALGSLGHDLAAQLVLQRHGARPTDDAVPGRYRVTGLLAGGLAGAAYVGVDRLTLQEVEIHLLLADQPEPIDPRLVGAIGQFCTVAQAAAKPGHPAVRRVLRAEPSAGLLVLPRAEGPSLRTMIRPPGLGEAIPRARALVAFMLEGLALAHDRGLVHGSLLPSSITTDTLGRPQLGPFGAHHLAGLAATRTGGLEELMVMTAPELRTGAKPTAASDLYAVGILLHALLMGRLGRPDPDDEPIAPAEQELIAKMTDTDPARRPRAAEILEHLRTPVADMRALGNVAAAAASRSTTEGQSPRLHDGVEVIVAPTWTVEQLDALCAAENPWFQPIIERHDRTMVLAPWPEGTRVLDEAASGWESLLPPGALDVQEPLLTALLARLRPSSIVVTEAGPCMLALDDLLAR